MRVSLTTIKQYIPVTLPVDELVAKINEQLGGVEEVIDIAAQYEGAVIVRVVSCEKHPNADKLTVCAVDDANVVADVERNEEGYATVVCGAPNVRAGMLAVWLPPRATVPATYNTAEPFVLDSRELRGIVSNGMLAAADELAIGTDHDGIVEINPDEWTPYEVKPAPGASFAAAYGLNDTVIDIENKMFTHRPDCFGQLGVAREIAGITGQTFESPDWYRSAPEFAMAKGLDLVVENSTPDRAPRFMAVAVKDVSIAPSPLWMQCELVRLGGKPINSIVDITNYVMLLTGQPTHAYDYDKLRGGTIGVRMAADGEEVTLLNGKTYSLTADDIVIVDGEGAVGLAGIMGGSNSEVSDTTTNIVLEVANFDMYTVRKTSMRHGIFTDALTRFTKGQSSLQQPYVAGLLLSSILDVTGGVQASDMFGMSGELMSNEPIAVSTEFINERLGLKLTSAQIIELLQNVEVSVNQPSEANSLLQIEPPFWRTDLQLAEDIVEEVGRLYGFDKLPRELPVRTAAPAPRNSRRVAKQRIRESFARMGANEVLTYSFVHKNVVQRAEQDVQQAFQLGNALSPDLQYYRLSVLPSLLDKVNGNVKLGYDEFSLFEIGKGHNKKYHADDDDGLPRELEFVDVVYASKTVKNGAPYYMVRSMVTQLAHDLGFTLRFIPVTEDMKDYPVTAPFDLSRSAMVESRQGEFIGMIGELKQSVRAAFKLPDYTAAMTLDLAGLQTASELQRQTYQPLSRYPSIFQDISLKAPSNTSYETIFHTVWAAASEKAGDIALRIQPVSIYQPEDSSDTKTTTLHIEFTSYNKTLTDADLKPIMDHVASVALQTISAERI